MDNGSCGICGLVYPERAWGWTFKILIKKDDDPHNYYRCSLCPKCDAEYYKHSMIFFNNAELENMNMASTLPAGSVIR